MKCPICKDDYLKEKYINLRINSKASMCFSYSGQKKDMEIIEIKIEPTPELKNTDSIFILLYHIAQFINEWIEESSQTGTGIGLLGVDFWGNICFEIPYRKHLKKLQLFGYL